MVASHCLLRRTHLRYASMAREQGAESPCPSSEWSLQQNGDRALVFGPGTGGAAPAPRGGGVLWIRY